MSAWNRRKKYSIDDNSMQEERPKFRFSKLVKHQVYLTVISILGVTAVILGSSYAMFTSLDGSSNYNTIKVGTFQIEFSPIGSAINLIDAFPVSDAEGSSSTKTPYKFTIKNGGSLEASYTIAIAPDTSMISQDNCANNLLLDKYVNFKLSSSVNKSGTLTDFVCNQGGKSMYCLTTKTLAAGATDTYELRLWINESAKGDNSILGRHFHDEIYITADVSSSETGVSKVLTTNQINALSLDDQPQIDSIDGLFNAIDDDGTSYVFRGNVNNNWVKFGKDGDNDLYWRIVRINGDGSIRLIYNGFNTNSTGDTTVIPDIYNYVGNDGNVLDYYNSLSFKTILDNWYNRVFSGSEYEKNIALSRFCVDSEQDENKNLKSKSRIESNKPSLMCVSADGNSMVKMLNVGTISVDEANIAGLTVNNGNVSNYLYNGLDVWTMSPYNYQNALQMWTINSSGLLEGKNLSTESVRLRPVINLVKTVDFSGSGTKEDPYMIK